MEAYAKHGVEELDQLILDLLRRYDNQISEKTIDTFCQENGINAELMVTVLEVYLREKTITESLFEEFSLNVIVDYLVKSHAYYLNKRIPQIENTLAQIYNHNDRTFIVGVNLFFDSIRKGLIAHMENEEQELFPAIIAIEQGEVSKVSIVREFMQGHTHQVEDALHELKKVVSAYKDKNHEVVFFESLVTQLDLLENDLRVHGAIEEKVLLPRALREELKLQ